MTWRACPNRGRLRSSLYRWRPGVMDETTVRTTNSNVLGLTTITLRSHASRNKTCSRIIRLSPFPVPFLKRAGTSFSTQLLRLANTGCWSSPCSRWTLVSTHPHRHVTPRMLNISCCWPFQPAQPGSARGRAWQCKRGDRVYWWDLRPLFFCA